MATQCRMLETKRSKKGIRIWKTEAAIGGLRIRINILGKTGARFLTVREGYDNVEREKTRTNIVILDESWSYCCELLVFNTKRYGNKYT